MTMEEKVRAKQENEMRMRQRNEKSNQEHERNWAEERERKAKREFEDALYERKLEREKEIKRPEEAIKKKQQKEQEERDAYKKCWNCDGKGWIGKEVMESHGGRAIGGPFNIQKTCSICNGAGEVKKSVSRRLFC